MKYMLILLFIFIFIKLKLKFNLTNIYIQYYNYIAKLFTKYLFKIV